MALLVTAPVPPIPTFTEGTRLEENGLNSLSLNLRNLFNQTQGGFRTRKPICAAYQTAPQSIPTNVDTIMLFGGIAVNTDNMWATGANFALQVNTPGWYRLATQIHYNVDAVGIRACKLLVNGTDPNTNAVASDNRPPVTTGEGTVIGCQAPLVHLAPGVFVYVNTYQNAGVGVSTVTTYSGSFVSAEWVAPY